MARISPNAPCPCDSGVKYKRCCRPWHGGRPVPGPEALMRSRYSAYALGLVEHVVRTTDPNGPQWRSTPRWRDEISAFCHATTFLGLEISEVVEGEAEGFVSFRATLRQGARDASFGERSRFRREGERWLYHSGEPLAER